MAWLIVAVTALVLAVASAWSIYKVRRARRRASLAAQTLMAVSDARLRLERRVDERAARIVLRDDTFVMVKGGNCE